MPFPTKPQSFPCRIAPGVHRRHPRNPKDLPRARRREEPSPDVAGSTGEEPSSNRVQRARERPEWCIVERTRAPAIFPAMAPPRAGELPPLRRLLNECADPGRRIPIERPAAPLSPVDSVCGGPPSQPPPRSTPRAPGVRLASRPGQATCGPIKAQSRTVSFFNLFVFPI
jgi:hypothetical protein